MQNQTLTLTLIQTRLQWEDKAANRKILGEKINAISDKTEIILLPETFSTGFSMKPHELAETMDGDTVRWMKELSASKGVIIGGSAIIQDQENFYNRFLWVLPNGQTGFYNKRHRFAYAGEDEHYTAGDKRFIASVKGWKINLQICYDLRFPVWSRQQSNGDAPEYDLLVYVANWPDKRIHAWRTLLQARAIENQCYVVGLNRVGDDGNGYHYTGHSMIVDAMGAVLYEKADEEDVHTHTISKQHLAETRDRFPFWKDADSFMIHQDEKEISL